MVDHPDVLVAFNRPSLEKFAPAVKKGGVIIYDSMAGQFQGPEGVKVISVPATEIATEHGAIQAAKTGHVRGAGEAGNLGLPKEACSDAFKVELRQEAHADPEEPGDPGGGSRGSESAGDGGDEVGQPEIF